jgi:hypothetical protein
VILRIQIPTLAEATAVPLASDDFVYPNSIR